VEPAVRTDYWANKLQRIANQSACAAAIIDHMRMFGRGATEASALIDPRKVVTNALDLMQEQLRSAGIKIVIELPKGCPCILGHII